MSALSDTGVLSIGVPSKLKGGSHEPDIQPRQSRWSGKTLGCWCKPEKCYGDILVKIIEECRRWLKTYLDIFSTTSIMGEERIDYLYDYFKKRLREEIKGDIYVKFSIYEPGNNAEHKLDDIAVYGTVRF